MVECDRPLWLTLKDERFSNRRKIGNESGRGSVGGLGRVSQGLTLSCGLTNARAEVPVIGRARMLRCGGWGAGKGVRKNALRDKTKTTSANGTTRVTGP